MRILLFPIGCGHFLRSAQRLSSKPDAPTLEITTVVSGTVDGIAHTFIKYEHNTDLVVHFHSTGILDEEYIEALAQHVKEHSLDKAVKFANLFLVSDVEKHTIKFTTNAS